MHAEILEQFKIHLQVEKNCSKSTVENYIRDLRKYLELLNKPLEKVNNTDVISYIIRLESEGKSKATISRNIASIRCFFYFLLNEGKIKKDPTLQIKTPRQVRKDPETLTYEEMKRLLNSPDLNSVKGMRDRAILELMYGCGLKASEIVDLKTEDVNTELEYIKIDETEKERYIPLGISAKNNVVEYLKYGRHTISKTDENALFLNLKGEKLTRQGVWKIVKSYAVTAKIDKNINPLTLRHSFAVHMIENGASVSSIQELLGHNYISTTQIYEPKEKRKLKEVYKKTHPRAN